MSDTGSLESVACSCVPLASGQVVLRPGWLAIKPVVDWVTQQGAGDGPASAVSEDCGLKPVA